MSKQSLKNRILSLVLTGAMAFSLFPLQALAAEVEVLPETNESIAFNGEVLAAVNTNLGSSSQVSGSFYAEDSSNKTDSIGNPNDIAYSIHVDPVTGEELTVVELGFEPLRPVEEPEDPMDDGQENLDESIQASYAVGNTRTIKDNNGSSRDLTCLYTGDYCTVWGCTGDSSAIQITSAIAAELGQEFDGYYPEMVSGFGEGYDADVDGKVAILCYDIDKNYTAGIGGSYVAGFFRPNDLVSSSGYVNGIYMGTEKYVGMNMDAIHLDTYPAMGGSSDPLGDVPNSYSTLVHEFQHLINFSYQVAGGAGTFVEEMDIYLNESFSMAAEHMVCGAESCANRIDYFNDHSTEGYDPGTSLTYWPSQSTLSHYTNSYLFGQYLRTRYGQLTGTNGNTIFRDVLTSRTQENQYETLALITDLLNTDSTQLVLDFWSAVYLKNSSGPYGFAGESWANGIDPYIYNGTSSGTSSIYNGGVKYYKLNSSTFTPSSTSNVTLLSLGSGTIVDQGGVPIASGVGVARDSASHATFTVTSSQAGYLFYQLSNTAISNPDDLQDFVDIGKNTPLTLDLTISGGEDATPSIYYFLMNEDGETSELTSLAIPAYTYPITIDHPDRGTIQVVYNGKTLSSGDRVVNGDTISISATPNDGYELTSITVDGKVFTGSTMKVTAAHTVSATFAKADIPAAGSFASGSGTESDPYVIETVSQLKYLAQLVNAGDSMEGKHIALTKDLDLEGAVLTPIGASANTRFAGHFDGQGHTLSNLTLVLEDAAYAGLFGYVSGSVTGVNLENQSLTVNNDTVSMAYVGSLAGYNTGEISFCAADQYLKVNGGKTLYLGGLCGANAGTIRDSLVAVHTSYEDPLAVSIRIYAGGITGRNTGTVQGCESQGAVLTSTESTTASVYQGGLVGYNSGALTTSVCTGVGTNYVQKNLYAGGAAGYQSGGSLTDCVVYAPNDALYAYGHTQTYSGGLIGYLSSGTVERCAVALKKIVSEGVKNISSTNCMGQILGYGTAANQCYYSSTITLSDLTEADFNSVGTSTSSSNLVSQSFLSSSVGLDFTNDWEIGKKPGVNYPTPISHRQMFGSVMTLVQPEHGSVSADLVRAYPGMTVTLSAEADEGYYLGYYTVDGKKISGNTFTVTGNHKISAVFEKYCVITPVDGNHGTVTLSSQLAKSGDAITVAAVPDEGYYLGYYTVDGKEITGDTFTVTGNHNVSAVFIKCYIITVENGVNGSVSLSTQYAAPGDTIAITPNPDDGYTYIGIRVNGTMLYKKTSFSPTEDCTVEPVFKKQTHSGTCGTGVSWFLTEAGELVVYGNGAMKDYTYTVPYRAPWYSYRNAIDTVTIDEGVTSIGNYAFHNCNNLTSVIIPKSVTSIDSYAFSSCTSLTSVVITEGVTSIGSYAFSSCTSLTRVVIPESVTSIGSAAFSSCTSLTSVVIPEGATSIGSHAFSSCTSLTSVVIPEGVTSIGSYAFSSCTSLTSVVIPESVTQIEEGSFSSCSSLSLITVADGNQVYVGGDTLYDPDGVFLWCAMSKRGVCAIPESVTSIGNRSFYGCSTLTSVEIPEGVTSIGESAFAYCSNLISVELSEGVTSIGSDAFYSCGSLTSVIIPKSVTTIGESAFAYCSNLPSMVIPESVTSIGSYAFSSCTSLTSVIIPKSVTYIGESAFAYCSNLISVELSEGVTSIGRYAFYSCGSLTSVIIPKSVTSIGNYAFAYCRNLPSIVISEGVTSIGDYVFESCTSLINVVISGSVTNIGRYAFSNCNKLTGVVISGVAMVIEYCAFTGCSSLTDVYYIGTESEWEELIEYGRIEDGNVRLTDANRHYIKDPSLLIPITVAPCKNGNIAVSASMAPVGTQISVSIIPNPGYRLSELRVNGSVLTGTVFHVSNTQSITVTATFTELVPADTVVIGGTCGTTVSWFLMESGELVIHGSGDMNDYKSQAGSSAPWYSCREQITTATIEEGVTSIGDYAFSGCNSLTSVEIPEGVTSIAYNAFSSCTSLTSVEIPEGVTTIGSYAFSSCTNLTSVEIPEGVTTIGSYAFSSCTNLTSVVIPESMAAIGNYAFSGCSKLADVFYIGTEDEWNTITFGSSNSYLTNAKRHYISDVSDIVSLTAAPCEHGAITLPALAAKGETVTITATPDAGYGLSELRVNSVVQTGTSFVVPDAQIVTVTAIFAEMRPSETIVIGGTCGTGVSWFLTEAGELVIHGDGAMKDYGSSSTPWSDYKAQIVTATIEDGVTSVGNYAFYYCSSLTSVVIPDGVTSIGDSAFYDCSKLADVFYVGTEEEWNTVTIGSNNSYLTNAKRHYISDVSDIVTLTAAPCEHGTINLPALAAKGETVTVTATPDAGYILSQLQVNSAVQTGTSFVVPDAQIVTVTAIFTEIRPGETIVTGGTCGTGVSWFLTEAGELVIHGSGAMEYYGVCGRWYSYREQITSVTIEKGLTSIARYAFYDCTNLTNVVIPDGVTSIGNDAFYGCSKLADVFYIGTEEEWNTITIGSSNSYLTNAKRHYISDASDIVTLTAAPCEHGTITLPALVAKGETVTVTATPDAGYGLSELRVNSVVQTGTSFVVPDAQIVMVTATFAELGNGNTILASGTCGTSVSWFLTEAEELVIHGSGAMKNYSINVSNLSPWYSYRSQIITATIQDGVTSIGNYTFYACSSLTSVVIPESVTSIGSSAFSNCSSLTSMVIPESVTSIGSSAFNNCSSLTSVVIPEGVTSIGSSAFYYCTSLTSVDIPESVTHIGEGAFGYCTKLTQISVAEENPAYIGGDTLYDPNGVFLWCAASKGGEYAIPSGVTSIGNAAFSGCSKLTAVIIPESATTIDDYAFFSCQKLTYAFFNGTEEQWALVVIGSNNEHLTGHLCYGVPVSLAAEGVSSHYPLSQKAIIPTSAVVTLSTGETLTVTENLTCDFAFEAVGEDEVTVNWFMVSQTIPVTVFDGGLAQLDVTGAHNANLTVHTEKDGYAMVAFYSDRGQMLGVQVFPVSVGTSSFSIQEIRADLTDCSWKVFLTDSDYTPICEAFAP